MLFAYLDEFGHSGPFLSRDHARYNTSPVFGLGGLILPGDQVRHFSTWFFQLKCALLDFEIKRAGAHPATWEKKGSSLYTTKNVTEYQELRKATNRVLNEITKVGGHVIYVGCEKPPLTGTSSTRLYLTVLREMLKRLNQYAEQRNEHIVTIMDEHPTRDKFLTLAGQAMYGNTNTRLRRLIEPPFEVESHRYQTVQCADWLCGLIGRLGAHTIRPAEYDDFSWAKKYFGERLKRASTQSSIRTDAQLRAAKARNRAFKGAEFRHIVREVAPTVRATPPEAAPPVGPVA